MNEYENRNQNQETGLEIAVIGMSARFPGAKTIEQFWENLKNNVESIHFFSPQELEEAGVNQELLKNPNFVKAWGVLEDIEYFDADFFNYTPKEAEIMDPQLRIFLECAWHALEDAGYNPDTYKGLIGLYAGNAPNAPWLVQNYVSGKINPGGEFAATLLNEHFSTQVSYHLNLKGPGIMIRTACSTSLVAIHMACVGLLGSDCDMALAGGVTVSVPQKTGYLYQQGMIYSSDGHCRTFDAQASGSVFGNGVGVVVLKRLADARADEDFIYAVVKGSAINNDGIRKVGYTAPSEEGQADVIRAAYLMAEVEPESIGCIEAHGTATPLGDPVEIEALKQAFNTNKKGYCAIGSVKSNLGHLNAAAGVAGFIKTVLALKHAQIPKSLNFENLNSKIHLKDSPFYVNTQLSPWKNNAYPRRAGVSSFGLGGTNAHVVLEETPEGTRGLAPLSDQQPSKQYQLVLLSAKTPSALDRTSANLVEFFKQNPEIHLADTAYTLQVGRKAFQYRKMLVCRGKKEAIALLASNSKKVQTFYSKQEHRPVIFMFPGQGDQYINMGIDLYRTEPLFRQEIDRCFEILKPLMGTDPKEILYPGVGRGGFPNPPSPGNSPLERGAPQGWGVSPDINQTKTTQPLVFVFEYALTKLLINWGITPRAMIGYSLGEYTAACISGVFSLEDALKLVFTRGKLMQEAPAGAMLSVPLTEPELTPLLNKDISLAIINGPSCIVAGAKHAIDAFENQMKQKRLLCMQVNMGHAAHSSLMNIIKDEYQNQLEKVTLNKPQIPYISNVNGTWISIEEATDPGYWSTHLCSTVRYSEGINELLAQENAVFLEIGPGRGLGNILRQHPNKKEEHRIIHMIKHPQQSISDDYFLLTKLGQLWLYGHTIDWSAFYQYKKVKPHRIPLPKYPFERHRYWIGQGPLPEGIQVENGSDIEGEQGFTRETVPEPQPLRERPALPEDFVAPRDELEKLIADIWKQVLGFAQISVEENFFDLNGDSLTATQLITRLQQAYPIELSLQEFFEKPTIAHLAEMVKKALIEKIDSMSPEELEALSKQQTTDEE
jgi:acyl transferase domain-containing protein